MTPQSKSSLNFKIIPATGWSDYELIDTGGYEKLERFGDYFLIRPEPQACWDKSMPNAGWEKTAHAKFVKASSKDSQSEKGKWEFLKKMQEQWYINYSNKNMLLRFRLGLTAFKHVGVFPEQAENWNYIYDTILEQKDFRPKVLNLFAYTGGASLAACAAGAEVTHVDAVRQVVNWSRENMEASKLDGIRWLVDDTMKFAKRELRRGNKYHGIILDPPAYGRGPEGEKWVLEDEINELIKICALLLEEQKSFLVLNLYSMGFSALVADNLISSILFKCRGDLPGTMRSIVTPTLTKEFGELYVSDKFGKNLPLGTFFRMRT